MHYSEQVRRVINHINENLTADITLEVLADLVHFSHYHFHRLFLICAGEAPMEYVRRLRLRSASRDLLAIQYSIIDIAAKYRFESQDGFSRAFKKYYGLTPGEYRKLNFSKQLNNLKKIEEVKTNMYDGNIYGKLECSHDDKMEALATLDKLLELSEKVKRSGLLSLETEIESVQPEIFKKSIQLLIDGVEPEYVREILISYTLCGNYSGKELLIRILIIEGILAIQQGIHTSILREKLSSFFGENFIGEISKHFELDSESQLRKIDAFIINCQDKTAISKETTLLEEPVNRMDNRSLQRLLREIDMATLVLAISGASGKTLTKVIRNVSKKLAVMLIDEITARGTSIILEISECQKQILGTMLILKNQGDIII